MSLIDNWKRDLNLFRTFKKYERELTQEYGSRKLPFVQLLGYEKTWGKPSPDNHKAMVNDLESWAFACAYKNGFSVARVPGKLYKEVKTAKGIEQEEITNHVFLDLMKNVNPYFNRFELWVLTTVFMQTTGNAYWWIVKDGLGTPKMLWSIPAHWMRVVPSETKFIAGYVMQVPTTHNPTPVPFEADEIIHFKLPSIFDLYYGVGPMYGAAYDISLNKNIKNFGINYFLNNAQPSGVLETDTNLTEDQYMRLQTMWRMKYEGTHNAGKIAILSSGLKFNKVGNNLSEMAFPDTQKSVRDGILSAFGVPASKLGLVEDVNRANADANDYTYQKETVEPLLTIIQEKINEKLMPMYDQGLIYKFDSPVPQDKDFRLREREANIRMGYSSIDEEREKDGEEPLNITGVTDVPLLAFNVMPADRVGEQLDANQEANDKPDDKDEEKKEKNYDTKDKRTKKWEIFIAIAGPQERVFQNTMSRFFESQFKIVMSNLNKYRSVSTEVKAGVEAHILFNMKEENERLRKYSTPHIASSFRSGVELGLKEIGGMIDWSLMPPNVKRAIDARIGYFVEKINQTSADLIKEALEEAVNKGEGIEGAAKRLQDVKEYSELYRARRVAQTEIIGSINDGQKRAYLDNGVKKNMWITARDERVRDSHMALEGQVEDITTAFTSGDGNKLLYPGDRSTGAPAEDLINCRCTLAPFITKD